jgi:hypothetical protein
MGYRYEGGTGYTVRTKEKKRRKLKTDHSITLKSVLATNFKTVYLHTLRTTGNLYKYANYTKKHESL